MSEFSFPKKLKLTKNQQFKDVLENKSSVRNDSLILYFSQNCLKYPRFGISVGKKFGNAVTRNRLKRLAREACRLSQQKFPAGYDYILIYSSKMTNNNISSRLNLDTVKKSLESLIAYAKRKYKL